MKTFLNKLPVLVLITIGVIILIYITHKFEIYLNDQKWFEATKSSSIIAFYAAILTVFGVYVAGWQLHTQKKDNIIANEYLNQPDFEFTAFCSKKFMPQTCCSAGMKCPNNCIDEHWFNLIQIGNLPATDIKISMYHEKDSNLFGDNNSTRKIHTLIKGGIYQYKVPPFTFPLEHFSVNSNGKFYVFLEYKSLYSGIRYKRVYDLEYTPISPQPTEVYEGRWENRIEIFSVNLTRITDSHSLSWNDYILGILNRIIYKISDIKPISIDAWLKRY